MTNELCVLLTLLPLLSSALFYDTLDPDGYSKTTFGSKTAYANNGLRSVRHPRTGDDGVRLVHTNIIFRHGTRSPNSAFMGKVVKLRNMLKSRIPNDWSLPINSRGTGDKQLLRAGEWELGGLGQRFRQRLIPDRFRRASNSRVFVSPTERTRNSAKYFVSNFFSDPLSVDYKIDSERLRFFDRCPRYISELRNNKDLLTEYYNFLEGPEMRQVLHDVIMDNGLEDLDLNTKDLVNLHTIAGLETAVLETGEPLPGWVKLFRPEALYVLEYLHDMKHYWRKANPFPINYEQVCPLWGAIMEQLTESAHYDMLKMAGKMKNQEPPIGVYWFAHAETLLPLVIKLGLFNESIKSELGGGDFLRAKGFPARLRRLNSTPPVKNLFRASHIIPFAGNLAFLLYHCPIEDEAPSLRNYCLDVLLNEQVVEIIPDVKERPLRLDAVLRYFKSCGLKHFNHTALCNVSNFINKSDLLQHTDL